MERTKRNQGKHILSPAYPPHQRRKHHQQQGQPGSEAANRGYGQRLLHLCAQAQAQGERHQGERGAFYVLRFYAPRARKRAAPHFHAGRPREGEGNGVIHFLCFPFFFAIFAALKILLGMIYLLTQH